MRMFKTVGRLKPGVTAEQAQGDLQRALDAVIATYPTDNEIYKERPARVHAGIGVEPLIRERTSGLVNLLFLLVGFLLLISSANVANMLLVRGVQRRGEAAIRRACGASGRRLAGQLFVESIVLALAGGVAGLIVAGAFLKAIEGSRLMRWQPIQDVPLDWRVLAFAIGTSLVTGIVFGFAPLRGIRKLDLSAELHGSSGRPDAQKWTTPGNCRRTDRAFAGAGCGCSAAYPNLESVHGARTRFQSERVGGNHGLDRAAGLPRRGDHTNGGAHARGCTRQRGR